MTITKRRPCFIFVGVSVVEGESESGGVTMELEMQWDGNPDIVLDVKTRVGVGLPIQVLRWFHLWHLVLMIVTFTECFEHGKSLRFILILYFLGLCLVCLGEKYWIHWGFQVNLQATRWRVSLFWCCFLFLARKGRINNLVEIDYRFSYRRKILLL